MASVSTLEPQMVEFVARARRATLATVAASGRPRLVPVCFVLDRDRSDEATRIWTPIDEKPKATGDPWSLARVRDILARPAVTLLVDRWSEDWDRLGWVRLDGRARIVEAGEAPSVVLETLREKYPQYAGHDLEGRPVIEILVEGFVTWGDLAAD
ncbi:MAG: TIGR03668 family PPOX class F420-dependent oxidoreductase [Chloroflexota bacterium]